MWEFLSSLDYHGTSIFFCKSEKSGPSGVQTLQPGNATVKLLQLSNRIHRVKHSLETTSIQRILSCLQVAGGRFMYSHISLFKPVLCACEGSMKCSISSSPSVFFCCICPCSQSDCNIFYFSHINELLIWRDFYVLPSFNYSN